MSFKNRNHILITASSILLITGFGNILPSSAQNQPNCTNPNTTIEYNRCARLAYETADRELNSVWQQVISQLSGNQKERLIDRQLAWIEERDSTCDRETADNRGGTGYRGFLSNCLRRVTMERTEFLRGYLR